MRALSVVAVAAMCAVLTAGCGADGTDGVADTPPDNFVDEEHHDAAEADPRAAIFAGVWRLQDDTGDAPAELVVDEAGAVTTIDPGSGAAIIGTLVVEEDAVAAVELVSADESVRIHYGLELRDEEADTLRLVGDDGIWTYRLGGGH